MSVIGSPGPTRPRACHSASGRTQPGTVCSPHNFSTPWRPAHPGSIDLASAILVQRDQPISGDVKGKPLHQERWSAECRLRIGLFSRSAIHKPRSSITHPSWSRDRFSYGQTGGGTGKGPAAQPSPTFSPSVQMPGPVRFSLRMQASKSSTSQSPSKSPGTVP